MPYDGGLLYPCGPSEEKVPGAFSAKYPEGRSGKRLLAPFPPQNRILAPSYSFTWSYNDAAVDERLRSASDEECEALRALRETMRAEREMLWVLRTPHTVGGAGYTHSIPNPSSTVRFFLDDSVDCFWSSRPPFGPLTTRGSRMAM